MLVKNGWDVWIEVDGKRLEEYQGKSEQGDNKQRVTCFIASEVDKVDIYKLLSSLAALMWNMIVFMCLRDLLLIRQFGNARCLP